MTAVLRVSTDEEIGQDAMPDTASLTVGFERPGRQDTALRRDRFANKNIRSQPRIKALSVMGKYRG